MLAATQIKRIITEIITTALRSGSCPTAASVAQALEQRLPVPGQPTFVPDPHSAHTAIDADRYTAVWQSIADDLGDLYTELYLQLARTTALGERIVNRAAALAILSEQMTDAVAMIQQPSLAVATWVDAFRQSTTIDASMTTAFIGYTTGTATLPPLPGTYQLLPLTEVTVTGGPLQGEERPFRWSSVQRVVDVVEHHAWMTQVIAPGGGCSYQLLLKFATPQVLTDLVVETTHKQDVTLEYSADGKTWTAAPSVSTIAVRVTLLRALGTPLGDQFLYTFGVKRIATKHEAYGTSATVAFRPWEIVRQGRPFTRIQAELTSALPLGTTVVPSVSLTVNGEPVLDAVGQPITNRDAQQPILLAHVIQTEVDLTDQLVVQPTGSALRTAMLPSVTWQSLSGSGRGVFVGDGQWRCQSYEYDWRLFPNRLPSQQDWDSLPQGIFPEEVLQQYCAVSRPSDLMHPNRMDVLNGPIGELPALRILAGMTYRWSLHVYCPSAVTRVTPYPERVTTEDIVGELLTAYLPERASGLGFIVMPSLNGKTVSCNTTGLQWNFVRGWNEIVIYGACPPQSLDGTALHLPTGVLCLGFSLSPSSFPGVTFAETDYDGGAISQRIGAQRQPLDLVSLFDLRYNTPLTYQNRAALDGTTLYVAAPSGARIVVRYDQSPDGAWTDDQVYVATLKVQLTSLSPSVTPVISQCRMIAQ